MHIEVELKARVEQPESIKSTLQQRFGPPRRIHRQDQYYKKDGDPFDAIRLRQEDQRCIVSYKDKKQHRGIEQNSEIEFDVTDSVSFGRFLAMLGFFPSYRKEKIVLAFPCRSDRPLYELVEIPNIGWFIEIEMLVEEQGNIEEARDSVLRALSSLGLSEKDIEHRTYKEMLGHKGA